MDMEAESRLIDALVERVCELTEEELNAELIAEGIDPAEYAREGREMAMRAIDRYYARLRLSERRGFGPS